MEIFYKHLIEYLWQEIILIFFHIFILYSYQDHYVETVISADVKAAIEKNGMTVDEFSKLLDPNRILTPEELKLVDSVRADVGLPQAGTVMNKTIPQRDIYNYLNNNYNPVFDSLKK